MEMRSLIRTLDSVDCWILQFWLWGQTYIAMDDDGDFISLGTDLWLWRRLVEENFAVCVGVKGSLGASLGWPIWEGHHVRVRFYSSKEGPGSGTEEEGYN